ncbi:MAG: hypothetical protein Q9217_001438, partial [Psora testacea]
MIEIVDKMNDGHWYNKGSHIACLKWDNPATDADNGFCLFRQDLPSRQNKIDVRTVKTLLSKLRDHGCKTCGSIPVGPDNKPELKGILTLNYVEDRKNCDGICTPDN